MAKVPTVAEIQEIQKRKALGLGAIATRGETDQKIDQLAQTIEQKVKSLERDVKKKRLSGVELADCVKDTFEKHQFDPVEELVLIATEKNINGQFVLDAAGDKRLRVSILQNLMEYVAPKLKSVEHSGSVDHKHEITILRFGDDGKVHKEKDGKVIDIPMEVASG